MMLLEKLVECGAIKFGDFTLHSGKKSNYYIDIKKASTKYEILDYLGSALSKYVKGDLLAGIELGGIPLVAVTAIKANKDYLMIRKERKEYGTKSLIEGEFHEGQTVDIIEDVVTTGDSVMKAVKLLRDNGLTVEWVICVVDREEGGKENLRSEGIELFSLLKAKEIKSYFNAHF